MARKHTRYAERDLRHLTARAVGQLGGKLHDLDHRILTYNDTPVNDQRAHDIVIRGLDAGVITSTQVPEVLKEWREPSRAILRHERRRACLTPSPKRTRR